ncbi:MAG TPA: ribosome maturation factor RimM [Terriglobales bacterium]|nr:ribosome maturation factor RimM [Terriglobales bacterium]
MTASREFITLARVVKLQGRRGEVATEVHSDAPDRFRPGLSLFALGRNDSRRQLEVQEVWPHKGLLVLKFAGVDSMADAEVLVGCELQVPRQQRAALEPGWAYISDLVGCTVSDGALEIGRVEDVRLGAGEAPLLIVRAGNREHEIPYAQAHLENVDIKGKRIRMLLPEGMLELDAPLTAEEKQQQRRRGQ